MAEFCSADNPQINLITKKFGKICKYHKRAGQQYTSDDIVKDFCFEAFYTAYPYCLALLYNAKFPNKKQITLSCPQEKGIDFTINRHRAWSLTTGLGLRLLKKLSQKLSYPLDIEDYQLTIKIIANHGTCPKKYPVGKTYQFNIRRLNELCPAAFYQLYPFFFSGVKNVKLHCPDHQGMSYLIKKGKTN